MQASDRPAFAKVLTGVHDFYRRDLSEFALRVWWEASQNFDLEQVTAAFSAHMMDPERGVFMPMPADLVRTLQGTQTDRALIAWGKVLDAAQRVGAYTSVVFDDGVIHAVIEDLGGWVTLCRTSHDELPHLQRRFCDSYRAYARRPEVAYPARLAGVHELQNAVEGRRAAWPTLIGDPSRAQAVATQGAAGPKTRITSPSEALRLTQTVQRLPGAERPAP